MKGNRRMGKNPKDPKKREKEERKRRKRINEKTRNQKEQEKDRQRKIFKSLDILLAKTEKIVKEKSANNQIRISEKLGRKFREKILKEFIPKKQGQKYFEKTGKNYLLIGWIQEGNPRIALLQPMHNGFLLTKTHQEEGKIKIDYAEAIEENTKK
ncbi:MAG: hypothetical protein ABIA76_03145 [Candidatus Diapherotrites archaeon]